MHLWAYPGLPPIYHSLPGLLSRPNPREYLGISSKETASHLLTCHPRHRRIEESSFSGRGFTMRDTAVQGTYKVQALDRAFAVLDLLGESETPLGLAQVAVF